MGIVNANKESRGQEPELAVDPPRTEESAASASARYLGYADGELVRDVRSGVTGRVRVRDDEETGRYAEVQWDGSFVSDQLELAIDKGLEREPEPPVGAPADELGHELDDATTVSDAVNPELIKTARDWISDCAWSDLDPEQVAELSDEEVLRGVEQHYDGGLAAFEEAGWFEGDEPALPYPVDEDGFPLVHTTYQSHTLPDDTYSWGCGKSGCNIGLPEYATRDEALAAALEHEKLHGYDRDAALVDVLEVEQDAQLDDGSAGEQELPELGEPVAVATAEQELAVNEQELAGPAAEAELAGPELEADDTSSGEAEVVAEQEQSTLAVAEPELAVEEPELGVAEPELGDSTDAVETAPETEPEPEQSSSWWKSKAATAKTWLDNKAAVVKGRIQDKAQFAKAWIQELRSGRHRQCHGAWEEPGAFGGVSECTIQVAKNEFGVTLDEVQRTYGHGLVNDILYRNDVEGQSYRTISNFMENTLLKGRHRELERDEETPW